MRLELLNLYTKILHQKSLKVIYELIDFCFDGGGNTYVNVTMWNEAWN